MDDHVLVPFDDSELGTLALERVLEGYPDAEITVLHVIDTRQSNYGIEGGLVDDIAEARQRAAERMIAGAERLAEDHGRSISTAVEAGRSGEKIVEYAEENDVDHVVMGSHDKSGISDVFVGHVAEIVMHNSPVPVTIVR